MSGGARAAVKTSHLELVNCSGDPLVFSVPTADHPHMSVSGGAPGLCLDNPAADAHLGVSASDTELQLWSCNDTRLDAQQNMRFFLTTDRVNSTEGTIRPVKNPSMCMSVSQAKVGAPVEMQACTCKTCRESFMLRVVNSAGSKVASSVRLLKYNENGNAELTEKQDVEKQGTADEVDEDAPEFDDKQMRMIVDATIDGFVKSESSTSQTQFVEGVADKIKRMYTPGAGQQYSRRQARKLTEALKSNVCESFRELYGQVTATCARALKQNEGAG
jgi:hypothetical protein